MEMKFLSPLPLFRVALCIDGPKRFCLNSKHLLGKEATKQRHLRLLGYQVVQVRFCLSFPQKPFLVQICFSRGPKWCGSPADQTNV